MPGVMTRDTIEPRRAVGLALLAADAGRWAFIDKYWSTYVLGMP